MQSEIEKWNAREPTTGSNDEMFHLAEAATRHLNGPVLEFGVYSGYSLRTLASIFKNRKLYGFDSWQGLPEDDPHGWESFRKGEFSIPKQLDIEYHHSNVKLVDGWFKDTLPVFVKEHPEPAIFINIDCDLYSSTKDVFDNVIVRPGTVIRFDEYKEYAGWEGREFRAFMEFIERTGYDYKYLARTDGGGQAMVQLIGK